MKKWLFAALLPVMALDAQQKQPSTPTGLRFVTDTPVSGSRLLTQSDFTYIGTCVIPKIVPGTSLYTFNDDQGGLGSYEKNQGLAYAVSRGAPYLFATANESAYNEGSFLYRFHCASWGTTAGSYPAATIDESYGDALDCKRVDHLTPADQQPPDRCTNGPYSGPGGIYIEDVGNNNYKYWWSYTPQAYAGDKTGAPSLGYSTLSIGTGSATGQAAYGFEDVFTRARNGSIVPIPAAWQGSFGGKHFFLCNVGAIEPHCIAFDLPTGANLSVVPTKSYRRVIGFGFSRCTKSSRRMKRPAWLPALLYNYSDRGSGECEGGDLGAFGTDVSQSFDMASQFLFIETGTKHGVLTFNNWTVGGNAYTAAVVVTAGMTTGWGVLDPAQMSEIFSGKRATDNIAYASTWSVHYPVFNYSAYPFQPVVQTASTAQSITPGDYYRFTFPSASPYAKENFFAVYSSTPTFNRSYKVVNGPFGPSNNQVDACSGQSCEYRLGNDSASNVVTVRQAGNEWLGRVVGAVWMPTNSACGVDNSFAISVDAPDGAGGLARYVHCYKVN